MRSPTRIQGNVDCCMFLQDKSVVPVGLSGYQSIVESIAATPQKPRAVSCDGFDKICTIA
ncbi:hypothetical protein OH492_14955 [Vibrio chagasii]|nr:hypothetical protein [Vibrio chagasii]